MLYFCIGVLSIITQKHFSQSELHFGDMMLVKSGQAATKYHSQLVILSIIKEVKKVGQVVLKTSI